MQHEVLEYFAGRHDCLNVVAIQVPRSTTGRINKIRWNDLVLKRRALIHPGTLNTGWTVLQGSEFDLESFESSLRRPCKNANLVLAGNKPPPLPSIHMFTDKKCNLNALRVNDAGKWMQFCMPTSHNCGLVRALTRIGQCRQWHQDWILKISGMFSQFPKCISTVKSIFCP